MSVPNRASATVGTRTADNVHIWGAAELPDLVDEWMAELRVARRRSNTLASYRQTWRLLFGRTGLTTLAQLTGAVLRNYLVSLERDHDNKPSTVHATFRVIRAFARWAERQEYPVTSSLLRVKAPTLDEPLIEIYSPGQLATLNKEVMSPRYLLLMHVLLGTGLRLAEALALRWEDLIDDPSGYQDAQVYFRILNSKSREGRFVPVSARLHRDLLRSRNRERGDPVIFGTLNRRAFQAYCRKISKRLGFHVHAHKFRHTYATRVMEERPNDMERLRKMLGHKSYAMTLRYTHLDRKSLGQGWERVSPY